MCGGVGVLSGVIGVGTWMWGRWCGVTGLGTVDVGALSGDAEWGQQCGVIEWERWVWGH